METGMLRRCVCVSFYRRQYINAGDQAKIFEKYGKVSQIIASKFFKDHFFVEFESRQSAMNCFQARKYLLQTFGYIIDLDGETWDEENTLEPYGGKVDHHSTSLMDLNEDCLLHLMSYLRKESAIKFVCAKLRRLWKMSWSRARQFRVDEKYLGLDRIYLSGHRVTQLTVYERAMYPILTEATYRLMFERCAKVQRLDLTNTVLSSETLSVMEKFLPAVTEIISDGVDERSIIRLIQSTKIEKCLCGEKVMDGFGRDVRLNELSRIVVTIKSLTTVVMPRTPIDIVPFLKAMPQLRVLICRLQPSWHDGPSITHHNLNELSVGLRYGALRYVEGDFNELIKIRQCCPNLRHLRVAGLNILNYDVEKLLPLEGLRIELYNKTDINLSALSVLADHLKVFFLDYKHRLPKDYPMILSQFSKLEMTSWFHGYTCDFGEYMKNRLAQTSLKVFVSRLWKPKVVDKDCQYLTDRTEFFGPFSIYRDWTNLDGLYVSYL